jgi:L-2-hydroxyglutarate oxidase LhgO
VLAHPDARVVVLEREPQLAQHQTSRNSGVVHAGLYYAPGSLKARLCTEGRARLASYAVERGLPYDECGKLVVATADSEVEPLREIHRRAVANGVPDVRWVDDRELREIEPAARGVAAVHSPRTAITDFGKVAAAYADDVRRAGGEIRCGFGVVRLEQDADRVRLTAASGAAVDAARVVTCAGLGSDRLADLAGDDPDPRIVPFRGDYYALRPQARSQVRGLIYPVPDPRFPFLGIHLTRTVGGEVLVGPNAVLAVPRRDLARVLGWPGFRRMARQHWRAGVGELVRASSRRAFAAQARRYVPGVRAADLVRAPAGVRAQSVGRDGALLQDFAITSVGRIVNVRNAPSPAATSSLAIADELLVRLLTRLP